MPQVSAAADKGSVQVYLEYANASYYVKPGKRGREDDEGDHDEDEGGSCCCLCCCLPCRLCKRRWATAAMCFAGTRQARDTSLHVSSCLPRKRALRSAARRVSSLLGWLPLPPVQQHENSVANAPLDLVWRSAITMLASTMSSMCCAGRRPLSWQASRSLIMLALTQSWTPMMRQLSGNTPRAAGAAMRPPMVRLSAVCIAELSWLYDNMTPGGHMLRMVT